MKLKPAFYVFFFIIFFGISALSYAFYSEEKERQRVEGRIKSITDIFISEMLDPNAVQFRGVKLNEDTETQQSDYICGEYNSKNGIGGYMGFRKFIGTIEGGIASGNTEKLVPVALTLSVFGMPASEREKYKSKRFLEALNIEASFAKKQAEIFAVRKTNPGAMRSDVLLKKLDAIEAQSIDALVDGGHFDFALDVLVTNSIVNINSSISKGSLSKAQRIFLNGLKSDSNKRNELMKMALLEDYGPSWFDKLYNKYCH